MTSTATPVIGVEAEARGQLRLQDQPEWRARIQELAQLARCPGDEGGDNSYNVVVQATDGDTGANPEDARGWFKVTVNVADVEEVGKIRLHPRDQLATGTAMSFCKLPRCCSPRLGCP